MHKLMITCTNELKVMTMSLYSMGILLRKLLKYGYESSCNIEWVILAALYDFNAHFYIIMFHSNSNAMQSNGRIHSQV